MKLLEAMHVEENHTLLDGLGHEEVGLPLAVERQLSRIKAPGVTWRMETATTGIWSALRGKGRDVLVIEHRQFPEYAVLVVPCGLGSVLHTTWMLVATPRLSKDIRRALLVSSEPNCRFAIGSELTTIDRLDLRGFVDVTKIALRAAIRQLTDGVADELELEESDVLEGTQ